MFPAETLQIILESSYYHSLEQQLGQHIDMRATNAQKDSIGTSMSRVSL